MRKKILVIGGPTASGKSALSMLLAQRMDAVIINADSMQVYREIPVITAQPSAEEQAEVPHRLYGVVEASERLNAAKWVDMAASAINDAHAQNKVPVLVGGTGMYLKILMEGIADTPDIPKSVKETIAALKAEQGSEALHAHLKAKDPVMAKRLEPNDTQRITRALEVLEATGKSLDKWQKETAKPPFEQAQFAGIFFTNERAVVYERCNQRLKDMVKRGALDEIRALREQGLDKDLPAMKALGVPHLMAFINGETNLDDAIALAQQHTRNYVKRQNTFFTHQLPTLKAFTKRGEALNYLVGAVK